MTPRMDIYYLDIKDSFEENRRKITDSPFSRIPVCKDGLDNVIGFVQAKDLLTKSLLGETIDLNRLLKTPRYVPKSLNPMQLLEEFKRSKTPMALVVDEYGEVAGLVTLKDVMEAIVGESLRRREPATANGSWLYGKRAPRN